LRHSSCAILHSDPFCARTPPSVERENSLPPPPRRHRPQTRSARIGAPTVTFRECVLDVGDGAAPWADPETDRVHQDCYQRQVRTLDVSARIGAPTVTFRECVLDIGTRAGRHGTGCRDKRSTSYGASSIPRQLTIKAWRCGMSPPFSALPTSSTHCRIFCRIGAGFRGQSAHLAWNSAPLHTCRWRISHGILH